MDPTQQIIQNAHEKNKRYLAEEKLKNMIEPKMAGLLDFDALFDSDLLFDKDVKEYKDARDKYEKKQIKTNLDLMEAFNETALKFIPLYQKRVNQ